MKNLIPILTLALSLPLAPSFAQETVTSVNAVGMVKVTVERGSFNLISVPFVLSNEEGAMSAQEFFGTTLPYLTRIYIWSPNDQNYSTIIENVSPNPFVPGSGGWSSNAKIISLNSSFFVQIPSNAAQETYDIVISGEVPSNSSHPEVVIPLAAGFSTFGFAYPVLMEINNPANGIVPANQDRIYFWTGKGYGIVQYTSPNPFVPGSGGWSNPNFVFAPGAGYFYQTNVARDWTITKTNDIYPWP